ncbi:MAG TPA: UPF0182 family protein [Jatrophihabitans sp.]|nr:UPF0182 family protein [Jatrophihabitans sp.]
MPSMLLSRRTKILLSVVAALIVLIIVLLKLSGVYVNFLWFDEVHQHDVYSTILWTRVSLFVIFGVLMAAIIGANLVVAYLLRPPFRPMSPEQQNLQNYVLMVEPRRKLILAGVMIIALLAAGMSAQGDWAKWQLWLNGGSFGQTDPQFHKDISFYAFDYPIYRTLLSFGFSAVIFSLILSIGVHYLVGAIRLQTPGPKMTLAARRHITVLVFAFMVLKAAAYWLDRYGFVFSSRSKFTGASYTDVHSALPAKTILFWITIVLALGVLASMWLRSALLPGIGFIVLLVLSILIGGIYPAIVQNVSVNPNASDKERPYIKRNIAATRQAYGIVSSTDGGPVTYQDYASEKNPSTAALSAKDATLSNVRILDPNVLSPTFAQQQAQQKNFYGFPAKLDVDRYTVDGVTRDYIVGVRELSSARLSGNQTNWINQHTNYTHGYGFVAAAANENVTTSEDYADGNIPQQGTLNDSVKLTVPQVYFGELVSDYAIVGAKGAPREFDGDGAKKVTYSGKGGISLGNFFTKAAFAVKYKETNFLLNDAVSASGARILINRDPRQRVEKVAPFLKVDGDPYPVVDPDTGHIVWMVDGYTTMANFPYSERQSLADLTSDSLTASDKTAGQPNDQINYIRNSVKATVDAYDGTVTLYQWDTKDPLLKAWMKIFPGLVKPKSAMPPSILAHVRYPEDLFAVQRSLLEQYHVDSPVTFYNTSDKWTIPSDPAPDATGDQPPYYVLADPQDGSKATAQFQLTTPMKVNNKTNLAAFITVDSDPGPDYGKMTVLNVPAGSVIQGPEQVANYLNSAAAISSYITLQDRAGSRVIHGNLLTLPVGDSFLYVEPLYVQAQRSGFPVLQRVLVYYGGKPGFAETLAKALTDLLPGHTTGQTIDGSGDNGSPPAGPSSSPSSPSSPSTSPSKASSPPTSQPNLPSSMAGVLNDLDRANTALDTAKKSGDLVKIAQAQQRVDELVGQLLKLRSSTPAGSASPSK